MLRERYNKRTIEEVSQIVTNFGYELLDKYQEGKRKMCRVIIKDEYGYKYDTLLSNLIKGQVPDFVNKGNPFTLSHNIPLWLEKENKSFKLFGDNEYKGSNKRLFFQCLNESCGEIFDMSWTEIYSHNCSCPFCSGQRTGKRNNLLYLRPDLAKEWDYKKNKENPENFTCGSNREVFWICSKCNYSWKTTIFHRTTDGTGCPKCADAYRESKIASGLKANLKERYDAISEYKILKNPNTRQWLPFDIYIPFGENPEINGFYIEVHGEQHYKFIVHWHKTKERFEYNKKLDKLKKKFAKKNGTYIEIDLRKNKDIEEIIKKIEDILS